MIKFFRINGNKKKCYRRDFPSDSKVFFERVEFSHLRFFKIIIILVYYYLLRLFGIIKKDVYISYVLIGNSIVSYSFCYPKSFKYPFMKGEDYQIGSVYTDPGFRKKGYAALTIENILNNINCSKIWYLSHSENTSSIKLCNKFNFSYYGHGVRENNKYFSFLSIYKILGRCHND